jgi:hypothetical protein
MCENFVASVELNQEPGLKFQQGKWAKQRATNQLPSILTHKLSAHHFPSSISP